MPSKIYIGTAGWSIPRAEQHRFPLGASHLARYSHVFPAVEINSTFNRPHRAATFERWASSVPRMFRFSVKLPRSITHDQRLVKSGPLLDAFIESLEPLGRRLGCLLVQLPPSFEFDARVVRTFLTTLRNRYDGGIAIEPRHASWFEHRADSMLDDYKVARVAADPPRADGDGEPGGWKGFAYFRLHGKPRIYYSAYEDDVLISLAMKLRELRKRGTPTWCIFDNTTLGAATGNALSVLEAIAADRKLAPISSRP